MKCLFSLNLLFASLILGATGAPTPTKRDVFVPPILAPYAPTVHFVDVTNALAKRDVFVPPILYPHAGTVWYSFQYHNVTWCDTTGAPADISNEALLLLAKGGVEAPFILAKGFDLRLGRVTIQVPYVFAGTDYQLVLFGDSGNLSPVFTIESDTSE
ncbi:hypothetical protein B0H11DRAFT_2238296 [Mycena galericulata]|nr:hypothetical protein B0H11DRAFT_2238296 [Mycena galericulata]